MRKQYTLAELTTMGLPVARENKVTKLIASDDGQFFLESSANAANLHSKQTGCRLFPIEFDIETKPAPPAKPLNSKEIVALISAAPTLAKVEELVAGHRGVQILTAAKKRREELKLEETLADKKNGRSN